MKILKSPGGCGLQEGESTAIMMTGVEADNLKGALEEIYVQFGDEINDYMEPPSRDALRALFDVLKGT